MTTETAAPAASDTSTTEQDDQAFAAGFSEARGETPPTPAEPTAQPDAQPAADTKADQTAQPAAPEPPAKVLAGLTEDEIKQMFQMVPGLKQQVDKLVNEEIRRLNGIYGGLNEEIKKLKTSSGQSPRTFKAGDLDEEFVREFPEIAEMVARSLSKVLSAQAAAPTAAAAPQPAAPAAPAAQPAQPPTDINALVQQRVDAAMATVNERAEKRTLAALHPDWEKVAQSPEFAKWMQALPAEDAKKYGESDDALVAAEAFTKFKAAQKKTNNRKQQNQERLEAAVTPTGDGAPTATTLDDEAAFQSGFNSARAGAS